MNTCIESIGKLPDSVFSNLFILNNKLYAYARGDTESIILIKYSKDTKTWERVECKLAKELQDVNSIVVHSDNKHTLVKVNHNVPAEVETWYNCYLVGNDMRYSPISMNFNKIKNETVCHYDIEDCWYLYGGTFPSGYTNEDIYVKYMNNPTFDLTTEVDIEFLNKLKTINKNVYSPINVYKKHYGIKYLQIDSNEVFILNAID